MGAVNYIYTSIGLYLLHKNKWHIQLFFFFSFTESPFKEPNEKKNMRKEENMFILLSENFNETENLTPVFPYKIWGS